MPERGEQELKDKNRRAWNRYFAANLDAKMRERLVEEERHLRGELTPFAPHELPEIKRAFVKRNDSTKNIDLPARGARIDFSNVLFDQYFSFEG